MNTNIHPRVHTHIQRNVIVLPVGGFAVIVRCVDSAFLSNFFAFLEPVRISWTGRTHASESSS